MTKSTEPEPPRELTAVERLRRLSVMLGYDTLILRRRNDRLQELIEKLNATHKPKA